MKTMAQQSWAAGQPLVLTEIPDPPLKPDTMKVAVKAVGVNPVDWKMRQAGPLRVANQVLGPKPPVVVGVDFAGVVVEAGAAIKDVKVGDAVVGGTNFSRGQRGSYSDTVMVREDQVCVLPKGFDLDVAASLPVAGVTAWMSLVEIAHVKPGAKVLVLGASGGVGQFCVQLARHVLDAWVAGVCSQKNVALVSGLGAQVVLDYGAGDALEQARAHGPFQAIVDCVGGYSASTCRSLLVPGGRHIMVAGDSVWAQLQVLAPPFTSRSILGVTTRARLEPLVAAVAAGKLRVNIAHTFPLAQAEEALQLSQGGRVAGKIVLHP